MKEGFYLDIGMKESVEPVIYFYDGKKLSLLTLHLGWLESYINIKNKDSYKYLYKLDDGV